MTSYKSIFVYLWVACSAYSLDEFQRCPKEFVQIDNSCYYFSTEEKNWWDAQTFCTDHNSYLVSIETTEELSAIDNYSINNNMRTAWCWTSGSYLENKNEFIWIDVQKPVIQKWCKSYPSAEQRFQCVLMGLRISGYEQCLSNNSCETVLNFICESKLNPVTNKSDIGQSSVLHPSKTINIYN